jgi:ribose 5-phosphate isomerase
MMVERNFWTDAQNFIGDMDNKMCANKKLTECEIDRVKDVLDYLEKSNSVDYLIKRAKKILKYAGDGVK